VRETALIKGGEPLQRAKDRTTDFSQNRLQSMYALVEEIRSISFVLARP